MSSPTGNRAAYVRRVQQAIVSELASHNWSELDHPGPAPGAKPPFFTALTADLYARRLRPGGCSPRPVPAARNGQRGHSGR